MHASLPAHTHTSLSIRLRIGGGRDGPIGTVIAKAVGPNGIAFAGRMSLSTGAASAIDFSGHCCPRLVVGDPGL